MLKGFINLNETKVSMFKDGKLIGTKDDTVEIEIMGNVSLNELVGTIESKRQNNQDIDISIQGKDINLSSEKTFLRVKAKDIKNITLTFL